MVIKSGGQSGCSCWSYSKEAARLQAQLKPCAPWVTPAVQEIDPNMLAWKNMGLLWVIHSLCVFSGLNRHYSLTRMSLCELNVK